MKMLTTLRAATLATLAGAAISLPVLAQATDYNNRGYYDPGQECRSQENDAQVIGGLLGAIAGGVAGSQVSGNGARTEGSVVGAVLGGIAGAAIGDESVDCDKKRNVRYYGTTNARPIVYGQTYRRAPAPVVVNHRVTTRRVAQPVRTNNGYRNTGYTNASYGRYNETRAQLDDVRYRLQGLREQDRRLERKLRHDYRPRLAQKRDWVCREIERLEHKKRKLQKRLRKQNRNYY